MGKIAFAAFKETEPDLLQNEIDDELAKLNAALQNIPTSKEFADAFLILVAKVQTAAKGGLWEDAHRYVWEATFFVNRAIRTSETGWTRIALVLSPLLSLAALYFVFLWILETFPPLSIYTVEFFPYLWYGAIGGLMVSYWGLVQHTIELDFDTNYEIWYVLKPLLGALSALISVIIIKGGMAGMAEVHMDQKLQNPYPMYVIAFLAGFSERFFVQLVDRVTTALWGGGGTKTNSQTSSGATPLGPGAGGPPVGNVRTDVGNQNALSNMLLASKVPSSSTNQSQAQKDQLGVKSMAQQISNHEQFLNQVAQATKCAIIFFNNSSAMEFVDAYEGVLARQYAQVPSFKINLDDGVLTSAERQQYVLADLVCITKKCHNVIESISNPGDDELVPFMVSVQNCQ